MAATETEGRIESDVVIVGGGLVGLTLGVALAGAGIETAVVDGTRPEAMKDVAFDGRVSSIALGSKRVLDGIGLWPALADDAQPILEIRVSDGDAPLFLHYDHKAVGERPARLHRREPGHPRRLARACGRARRAPPPGARLGRSAGDHRRRYRGPAGRRQVPASAPRGRRRRRQFGAAGGSRDRDRALVLRADRHRLHCRARAAAPGHRARALSAGRALRHPADDRQPLLAGLDRAGGPRAGPDGGPAGGLRPRARRALRRLPGRAGADRPALELSPQPHPCEALRRAPSRACGRCGACDPPARRPGFQPRHPRRRGAGRACGGPRAPRPRHRRRRRARALSAPAALRFGGADRRDRRAEPALLQRQSELAPDPRRRPRGGQRDAAGQALLHAPRHGARGRPAAPRPRRAL